MKSPALRQYIVATVLASIACAPRGVFGPTGGWVAGTTQHSLQIGQTWREYLLHVPASDTTFADTTRHPLLLIMHGSSGSAAAIRQTTGMDSLSDSNNFVVAYLQGTDGAGLFPSDWNGGVCCGEAEREHVDDLGFISGVIAEISFHLPIDSARVFVAGFSSGGIMAYHAACKLAPVISAIAVVSGSLQDTSCAPGRPVGLIAVQGTDDSEVPYNDPALTPVPASTSGVTSQLPPSVQFWVAKDGCIGATANQQSANVVRTSFSSCSGAAVTLYTIIGGWHEWPTPSSDAPLSQLDASKAIVQYLLNR